MEIYYELDFVVTEGLNGNLFMVSAIVTSGEISEVFHTFCGDQQEVAQSIKEMIDWLADGGIVEILDNHVRGN